MDEYEARVGIEWTGDDPILIYTLDNYGYAHSGVSNPLKSYTAVESTIMALASDSDFLHQIAWLSEDCVNQGGISVLQSIREPDG